jgi:hypothetical protein
MEIPSECPWEIPAAASGEFRAGPRKKSDDTAKRSSARRRHQGKPSRANSDGRIAAARAVSFSGHPSIARGIELPSRYYSQPLAFAKIFLFTVVQAQHRGCNSVVLLVLNFPTFSGAQNDDRS